MFLRKPFEIGTKFPRPLHNYRPSTHSQSSDLSSLCSAAGPRASLVACLRRALESCASKYQENLAPEADESFGKMTCKNAALAFES